MRLDKGSGAGVMLEHPRNIGGIFPDRVEWEKGGVGGPGREERVLKPLERGSAQLRLITRAGVEMYQRPAVRPSFISWFQKRSVPLLPRPERLRRSELYRPVYCR